MEYVFSLIDENVNLPIVENAQANSNGMNAILKSVCGMNQFARRLFMTELNTKGSAEIVAGRDDEFPFTIFAKNLEIAQDPVEAKRAAVQEFVGQLNELKPPTYLTKGFITP